MFRSIHFGFCWIIFIKATLAQYFYITKFDVTADNVFVTDAFANLSKNLASPPFWSLTFGWNTPKSISTFKVKVKLLTAPLNANKKLIQWRTFYETSVDVCKFFERRHAANLLLVFIYETLKNTINKMPKSCPTQSVSVIYC